MFVEDPDLGQVLLFVQQQPQQVAAQEAAAPGDQVDQARRRCTHPGAGTEQTAEELESLLELRTVREHNTPPTTEGRTGELSLSLSLSISLSLSSRPHPFSLSLSLPTFLPPSLCFLMFCFKKEKSTNIRYFKGRPKALSSRSFFMKLFCFDKNKNKTMKTKHKN